jgi:hypothetical protein
MLNFTVQKSENAKIDFGVSKILSLTFFRVSNRVSKFTIQKNRVSKFTILNEYL